jgi:hypothetical protein
MNYTRIQILNHDNGICGIRFCTEDGNTTNIIEMSSEEFRELANQMLMSADKADAVKLLGPSVLNDLKQI